MGSTPLIPQVFVICGVGALAGLTYSIFHTPQVVIAPTAPVRTITTPTPGPVAADPTAADTTPLTTPTPTTPASDALGLEISIAQAKALFDAGAPFIDSRFKDEYDQGHVAGAFHMTADQLTGGKTPDVLNFLDPAKPVVIYCGGGACDASHNVTALLQQLGFTQCHVMTDGYPAWKDAGHPTATDNPLGATLPLPTGGANG